MHNATMSFVQTQAHPSCLGFGLQLTTSADNNPRGDVQCIPCKLFGSNDATTINIPDTIRSIEASAFAGCMVLASVNIPDSVVSVGASAFTFSSALTAVTIATSVTTIGEEAFRSCSSLTSIALSNSITAIASGIFQGCTAL